MRLKPKEFQIDPNDPFNNDLLNREEYIQNLLKLLQLSSDSLVLALIGKYGVGKTTLLKMMEFKAKLDGFKVVYFNAWESDYLDDPFSSILSEITKVFPSEQELANNLKKAGLKILKIGIPALIKAGTMNLIDLSDATEEAISQITSEFASAELEKHLQFKNNIENFKNKLSEITNETDSSNYLIIVDELDRCKPSYAIKLLESVKHIFDVKNIHFIIGLDYSQLSKSVTHIYGQNTDANGYLRRFFDFQIELPDPSIKDFIDFLFESYELETILEPRLATNGNQYDKQQFASTLKIFSEYYNASLRDLEKCFNIFSYVLSTTEPNYLIFPSVLAYLIIEFIFNRNQYNKLIRYETEQKELIDYFYNNRELYNLMRNDRNINASYLIGQIYITSRKTDYQGNSYDYFDSILGDSNSSEDYKTYISEIKEASQHYRRGSRFDDVMGYLNKKIQFIDTLKVSAT